jgi:hypothetical protein
MIGGRIWSLNGKAHKWFRMETSVRNGSIVEYVYLRKIDGRWRLALRLSRQLLGETEAEVKRIVDKECPRTPQGERDWQSKTRTKRLRLISSYTSCRQQQIRFKMREHRSKLPKGVATGTWKDIPGRNRGIGAARPLGARQKQQ